MAPPPPSSSRPPPERRDSPRLQASLLVRFETFDDFLVEYTENISRGGLFVRTASPAAVGSVVRIAMELPGGDARRELTLLGRVTRAVDSAAAAGSTGGVVGIAVEFLDLGAQARRVLDEYVQHTLAREQGGAGPGSEDDDDLVADDRPPPRILLVDDSEAIRREIGETLSLRGFVVRTAENGIQGLGAALKERPDAIISDVEMPGMDGWTFLRMVRARKNLATLPFVFLTRLGGDEERLRGYRLGVDDYLPKETTPAEIIARVGRLLRRERDDSPRNSAIRSLRGDLEQVSLANLLSFMDLERKTGVLSLVDGSRAGAIYLRHGQAVRAVVGKPDLSGLDRMFEVLGWTRGEFEFVPQEVPPEVDDLQMKTIELLIEHARRSDEAGRAGDGTP